MLGILELQVHVVGITVPLRKISSFPTKRQGDDGMQDAENSPPTTWNHELASRKASHERGRSNAVSAVYSM